MIMGNFLDMIAANKRREVEAMKMIVSEDRIFALASQMKRQPLSLKGALRGNYSGVIAEFKRRSPLKGNINPDADVETVVRGYVERGAAACSVLTDTRFFGGSLADLAVARKCVHVPLLRKDFMVDKYQVAEAYLYGADAILLIASMLTLEEIEAMMVVAHSFGMEALVEIHSEQEIAKIPACTDLVGVNNRNMSNFAVNLDTSYNLVGRLPEGMARIAESGICSHNDIHRLRTIGYDGFLIGETFMKKDDPAEAMDTFMHPQRYDNSDIHPNKR